MIRAVDLTEENLGQLALVNWQPRQISSLLHPSDGLSRPLEEWMRKSSPRRSRPQGAGSRPVAREIMNGKNFVMDVKDIVVTSNYFLSGAEPFNGKATTEASARPHAVTGAIGVLAHPLR